MTDAKLKEALKKMGMSDEEMEKVLAAEETKKIIEIAAGAKTADEAIEAIAKEFPDMDKAALKAQIEGAGVQAEKAKAPVEMSMDALESVAGGADGDDTGKIIGIVAGAVALAGGIAGAAVAGVRAYRNSQNRVTADTLRERAAELERSANCEYSQDVDSFAGV